VLAERDYGAAVSLRAGSDLLRRVPDAPVKGGDRSGCAAPEVSAGIGADRVTEQLHVVLQLHHVWPGLARLQIPVRRHGAAQHEEWLPGHLQQHASLADDTSAV